jgi:hypothetical protein
VTRSARTGPVVRGMGSERVILAHSRRGHRRFYLSGGSAHRRPAALDASFPYPGYHLRPFSTARCPSWASPGDYPRASWRRHRMWQTAVAPRTSWEGLGSLGRASAAGSGRVHTRLCSGRFSRLNLGCECRIRGSRNSGNMRSSRMRRSRGSGRNTRRSIER